MFINNRAYPGQLASNIDLWSAIKLGPITDAAIFSASRVGPLTYLLQPGNMQATESIILRRHIDWFLSCYVVTP